ncbi:MAG: hypothetical protein IPG22_06650 [Acidobacteria bacterium]|nr:hypothetical protein [Acidobacteriota bacterium]
MDEDRYYNLGSHDKLFNQIDELTDALASRDDEIKALRKALLHMCGNTIAKDTYSGLIVSEALGYRHNDRS